MVDASLYLLIPVGLVILGLAVYGMARPVNAKLGLRNVFRRKTNTLLVVLGLMVSTSIIGASFIVGDTMDEMVTSLLTEALYETDLEIGYTDMNGSFGMIDPATAHALSVDFSNLTGVDAVSGVFSGHLPVFDATQRLAEPSAAILGYDSTYGNEFGAFTVGGKSLHDEQPGAWDAFVNEAMAENLDASVGDHLIVYGPGGRNYSMNLTRVIDGTGKGNTGGPCMFMRLSTLDAIYGQPNGTVNLLRVTLEGDNTESIDDIPVVASEVERIIGSAPYNATVSWEILQNKKETIDNVSDSISMVTDMFLVMGSFSIIAGVVLIVNIFTMLAEERKSELGIARAIGTSRGFLQRMFMFEGVAYATMSVAVGVAMSIPLAFAMIWAFSSIFSDGGGTFNLLQYFKFETSSIVISVAIGFMIAVVTIFITTFKIARLNIVRAVRNIPEPPVERKDRSLLWLGILLLVAGTISALVAFPTEKAMYFWPGISLAMMGAALIARRFTSDRLAYSTAGILILVAWSLPIDLGMTAGMEMWVLSGIFMVGSSVVILLYNFDALVSVIDFALRWVHRSVRPVLKMAIAYPSTSKFKTGLTIAIFTMVMFTITVMSMINGFMTVNTDRIKEEVSGGMDIFASAGQFTPVDNISARIGENETLSKVDFDYCEGFVQAYFILQSRATNESQREKPMVWMATGVTRSFVSNMSFTMLSYDERFASEADVWNEVLTNSSTVILDGIIGNQEMEGAMGGSSEYFVAGVGETVSLVDVTDGKTVVSRKRVVGVLNSMMFTGVFVKKEYLTEELGITGERTFLLKLGPREDVHEVSLMLERALLRYGFQTLEIDSMIDSMFEAMDSMFLLMDAFLGLGLIIGIAGLGIITIRSVHERRQQIGMLRAIGFKRSWVMASFALEASIITILGIVIGVLLGIDVGFNLWYTEMRPMDYRFYIPWGEILMYAGIAFFITIFATIPPSRKAATVSVADALRYE